MSQAFRAQLVLMAMGWYGYGDHVGCPSAFGLRLEKMFRRYYPTGDEMLARMEVMDDVRAFQLPARVCPR